MESDKIYQLVQDRYGKYATSYDNELHLEHNNKIAEAFGYSIEELTSIPEGANLGVSCGNPLATAKLGMGEVVIDLGSGAGFDIFLAAQKVGPTGRAIGVDMNKHMLELARKNASKSGASNVSFIEASITSIPLSSSTADCIISNCVINLVPESDKPLVFREIFRLLKPGGRVSLSDTLAKMQLPEEMRRNMALYVGCISGASLIGDYERYLKEAGFEDVLIFDEKSDLNVYKEGSNANESRDQGSGKSACCSSECCSTKPPVVQEAKTDSGCCSTSCCDADLLQKQDQTAVKIDDDLNKWAGFFRIYAIKPERQGKNDQD